MNLGIADRVALVCGASRGIGRDCAITLATEGVRTVLLARSEKDLASCAGEIEEGGGKACYFPADLSDTSRIQEYARRAGSFYGKIDILINNAGGPPAGENLSFDPEDWERAFRLNLMSAVELTRCLIPPMSERGWGRVINLASITVLQPVEGLMLSNSIRMAVVGWAKTLSRQFAPNGVTVNTIATGYTLTERVKDLAMVKAESGDRGVEQVLEEITSSIPMRRMAQPQEIAALVAFLAGDPASYITGAVIPIDGGYVAGV